MSSPLLVPKHYVLRLSTEKQQTVLKRPRTRSCKENFPHEIMLRSFCSILIGYKCLNIQSECTQNYLYRGAAIAQWIRLCLPSCRPRFQPQAHHQHFYQFIFDLCHVEKTKINKKRPGLAFLKIVFIGTTLWLDYSQCDQKKIAKCL